MVNLAGLDPSKRNALEGRNYPLVLTKLEFDRDDLSHIRVKQCQGS